MRTLLLAVLFACLGGIASSREPDDRVYKFPCSASHEAERLVAGLDGFLTLACAESPENDAHVRVDVCDGSVVTAMVGSAESLAALPSPCSIKPPEPLLTVWKCARGLSFTTEVHEGLTAFIKAGEEHYLLLRAPSSPAGLYERRGVVFQQGEASAELIGAAGGPYERCVA
jgi:hypothetical protein